MALQLDRQQAIGLAHRPQEDDALQRKLWLAIALHLVQTASSADDQHPVSICFAPGDIASCGAFGSLWQRAMSD